MSTFGPLQAPDLPVAVDMHLWHTYAWNYEGLGTYTSHDADFKFVQSTTCSKLVSLRIGYS